MNTKNTIAIVTLFGALCASGAMAQTWLPPKEIAPKTEAGAASPAVTPAPEPAPVKTAEGRKKKEAKTKNCRAQGVAKNLHGRQRKKFIQDCTNS
jgi:hypothetical protein